ncbi:MAG: hypothetical protein ABI813_13675 [Bacteroidota bacterium]
MKNLLHTKKIDQERPDYYITPTRDFTRYMKDCAEKYWSKETAFDWSQSVTENIKSHLESLSPGDFSRIAFMALPVIEETIDRKIKQIKIEELPLVEDALKSIGECVQFDRTTIQQTLLILSPLKTLQLSVSKLKDQLEILRSELLNLRELQKLGLFKKEIKVKHLETEAERKQQILEITNLSNQINQVQAEYNNLYAHCETETKRLKLEIRSKLHSIEHNVLADLEETKKLIRQTLDSKKIPNDPIEISRLKDLIFKRQVRGLKDIANHALVVEQSAIAPLTMGIIHYKRHRDIQEAMTTFINDEAKHSATFRRFLAEKLEAKEYISAKLIKGANRYMWIARYMPGAGLFLAVIVESIGAAVLEFFGKEEYMPDKLFCSICKIISYQDERRHLDLCVDMYNELFRKGNKWEGFRNQMALKKIIKSVYGDKSDDHPLIQAFRVFGVESDILYRHIAVRLSEQLARISMYVEPDRILDYMGRK